MPIFDFHCHPGMKPHLAPPDKDVNPWESIHVQAEVLNLFRIGISSLFTDALDSQASLEQMWRGGVNLFGLIIHSIESHVAEELLKKDMVRNGKVLQLHPGKIENSTRGDRYFDIMMEELEMLVRKAEPPASMLVPAGARLKFIKSMDEYDRNNPNVLHALLILEGSQNLFNNPDSPDHEAEFIQNLDLLSSRFRIFAINVCHFQQQPIANHAFAMLFLKNDPFFPTGRGITPWGEAVILEFYRRGILVDTKHMGLISRHYLYRLRRQEGITLPLICSHAGVTGIREGEWLSYIAKQSPRDAGDEHHTWQLELLKKWGHVKDTAYNMASLQLFDEDIEEIILSGGMIGISMDQRIIGFPSDEINVGIPPTDPDFISKLETDLVFGGLDPRNIMPRIEDNDEVMFADDAENQNQGSPSELHALYFLNQVLHILWVAKNNDRGIKLSDGLAAICIGSDFDGLINPLDCCASTAQYPAFRAKLLGYLNKKSFWRGTGFRSNEINPEDLLERLFFSNAESFLRRHYV